MSADKLPKKKAKLKSAIVVPSTSCKGIGRAKPNENVEETDETTENFEFEGEEIVSMGFDVTN